MELFRISPGTVDDDIYKTERTGTNFGYEVFLEKNKSYIVNLHFAEIFWGATGGGAGSAGQRVFDVILEGDTVLNDYDIFASVGAEAADIYTDTIFMTDSIMDIDFIGVVDQGKISAIEILCLDTSACTAPIIDSLTVTNVTCAGDSDGVATVYVSGGTAPYSYNWANGNTTSSATGLTAGSLSVTVTDSEGCTVSSATIISQPNTLIVSTSKGNISCNNLNNGTAAAFPSGGTGEYAYSWDTSPVQTTNSISSLAGGIYTCTITDDNGCTATSSVSIFNPSPIIAFTFGNNPGPGDINLAVSGGIAPYTYNWSTGATTEDLNRCCHRDFTSVKYLTSTVVRRSSQ